MSKKPLSKISLSIGSGITPLRSNSEFWDSGTIRWLKTEQLGQKYIYDTTEHITQEALDKTSIKLNPINTISIAMYGEGRTRGSLSILKSKMTTNQACCNVVLDPNQANVEYVYYFLKTQYQQLRNLSSGVRKNLNSNDIKSFEIPLPENVEEQRRISDILTFIDKKIEINNRINAELEAMAKTLYDYWFVQFDFPFDFAQGKPDPNGKPYKSSGGKMVYNETLKQEIPEGWETQKLSDWIASDKSGDWGKNSEQGNYRTEVTCIRGADINGLNGKSQLHPPVRYILNKNEHKLLGNHEIIIEISGGSPSQSTGRLAYITKNTLERFNSAMICSNFCKAISLKSSKSFFNFIFLWNRLYDAGAFFGWEGKTSGIKNLLFDSFTNSYQTETPPIVLQKMFYNIMNPIDSKKQKALRENQQLTQLRDWLLPMLMNGQVRVMNKTDRHKKTR